MLRHPHMATERDTNVWEKHTASLFRVDEMRLRKRRRCRLHTGSKVKCLAESKNLILPLQINSKRLIVNIKNKTDNIHIT
jgi:hypothetical protein